MVEIMKKLKKNIGKLKKTKIKFVIFGISLILLNVFFLNHVNIQNAVQTFGKTHIYLLLTIIILEVAGIIFLLKTKLNKWKIENIFLAVAIPTGILYALVIPIGVVPDEGPHFFRAYEISNGHLISDKNEEGIGGRELPIEVNTILSSTTSKYEEIIDKWNIENSGIQEFMMFSNTASYSFVCYLPQTIGILAGKALQLPMLGIAYLGRLFNLATWIAIMYVALKIIPCYKKLFLITALLPITMQEAASMSADALTICMCFLLISFVLYFIKTKKDKISRKKFILLLIITTVVSLCKIVYIPLCLLLLLIPKERFENKKDRIKKIAFIIGFAILINLVWLSIGSQFLVEFNQGVNSGEQVKYILSNPFAYLQVMASTIFANGEFLSGTLSRSLESFNVTMPYVFQLLILIMMVISIKKDTENVYWNSIIQKLFSIGILGACILLIFTSLYVQWTPVKSNVIDGIQGRYFIPLLLLIPMIATKISDRKIKITEKGESWFEQYLCITMIFINIAALTLLFYTHI